MSLSWFHENLSRFSGELRWDEPLSRHTYYRIGGPARVLAIPKSIDDLKFLAEGIRQTGLRSFVLGLGSNLLVSDSGFDGLVIKTGRVDFSISVQPDGVTQLRTGAGVAISTLLRRAAQEGWGGLEFLTGVPGSVGGAVFMNAGTHLGEAKDRLRAVEAFVFSQDQVIRFERDELRFEYRRNFFLPADAIVTAAEWFIDPVSPDEVKLRIDQTLFRRKATQPVDYPSCGSVFKNPRERGLNAWQVVDQVGLRGHRIGDAQFAEKHSNFIINLGSARAEDVKQLIDLAKERARSQLGVELEEEVRFVGFE